MNMRDNSAFKIPLEYVNVKSSPGRYKIIDIFIDNVALYENQIFWIPV